MRFPLVLASLVFLTLPGLGYSSRFLHFSAESRNGSVDVLANQSAVFRLRGQTASLAQGRKVADALSALALTGLKSGEVAVRAGKGAAEVVARGQTVVVADAQAAKLARTTPSALATSWATNLRRALAIAYVALDPQDKLQVPVAETRTIRWGGTEANVRWVSMAPEVASLQADPARRIVMVRGVAKGTTAASASVEGAECLVTLEVREWAAKVEPAASVDISGPPLPRDDLCRAVRNAVLFNTQPAADALVEVEEAQRQGEGYQVLVRASAPECFDVKAVVSVKVNVIAAPKLREQELMVSNLPEKITEPATLLREQLEGTAPVRLLWHHVNLSQRPLRFVVRVANRGTDPVSVHLTESATGPNSDEIYAGHTAMFTFLRLLSQGSGYVLSVPPKRMLELYDVRLPAGQIVSGLARLTPRQGRNLLIEIAAESHWPEHAYFMPVPDRLMKEPPLTPYRFEAEKGADLEHSVGGPWTFYHIGKEYSLNLQGQKLHGEYGVLYRIKATFKNGTDKLARCQIALRASGGVARGSFTIDGELLETGLVLGAGEYVLYETALDPGQTRTLSLTTMPESGSNYPVTLILRSSQ